jgi:calcium-dependent protein kinase
MGCVPMKVKPVIIITEGNGCGGTNTSPNKPLLDSGLAIHMGNKRSTGAEINMKNMISRLESRVIDHYKILNKLGKGSFGTVFKVLHLSTGLLRAMKIIKKEVIKFQDDEKKFLKEIDILIEADHPNIIKIYEYYEDEVNFYLITEYVSGGELYETICTWKDFNEEKAAYIMYQILSAINYLHSKKIVHRDIKPENMLVESIQTQDNHLYYNIKLIDFGTCNYYDKNKQFTTQIGSPYYIAPEVINKSYNEKCDLWSCGVILYVLLVGYPPFNGRTHEELYQSIISGKYSLTTEEWSKISKNSKDLVSKLLIVDVNLRLSAQKALEHDWIQNFIKKQTPKVDLETFSNAINKLKNFHSRERLQQVTIAYIVHFLYSNKEYEELIKIFKTLDKNNDGRLTYIELKEGYKKVYGKHFSEIEINRIIDEVDTDKDGYISYEEFLRVALSKRKIFQEKNLKICFEKFDVNKDGKLSRDELKIILGDCANEYLNALLLKLDTNHDGEISYEEFVNMMNGLLENKSLMSISNNQIDNISNNVVRKISNNNNIQIGLMHPRIKVSSKKSIVKKDSNVNLNIPPFDVNQNAHYLNMEMFRNYVSSSQSSFNS